MLFEKIEEQKEVLDIEVPEYITNNLKFPLYPWQKEALENFLVNEFVRIKKIKKGEVLSPNHLMFNMATGSGKTLVMAAMILYYYKKYNITNFIFFVNQNAILGKTQDNFIHKNHTKYLFRENIQIDGKKINIKEVEQFSSSTNDIQIKFTTIQKLHNDIYKESENSLLLSDLQKRNLVLIGDEAHHLNSTTKKKNDEFDDMSFTGELKDSAKDEDIERSWETTVCHYILNKGKKSVDSQNKNVLLEFTATVPETEEVQKKYEDKIIIKFGLKEFVNAGCTKHIRLVRSNLSQKERILQALVLNWYRFAIALKHDIPNFKPVILFRSKTIDESKQDYQDFIELCKSVKASDFDFIKSYSRFLGTGEEIPAAYDANKEIFANIVSFMEQNKITNSRLADYVRENFTERNCIITNSKDGTKTKEKTTEEIDRQLNSLEDIHNHIRAVFTVQRLTEGWDVLNLFDIVRLYTGRDTNTKTNKAGASTTSEVQLIGRGVRYYPFSIKENPEKSKNKRKFDNDLQNELRVLEEFYFHSDNDSRYISELSDALKRSNLIQDTREEKKFAIKKEYAADFKKMYLLCNTRIDNENRRLKTLPEDLVNIKFSYEFEEKSSHVTNVNMNGDDEKQENEQNNVYTQNCHISDVPRQIKYKAIHSLCTDENSYFNFANIKKRFNVKGMEEFLNFINPIPIELVFKDGCGLDNEEPFALLEMTKQFLWFTQSELEKYDHPYKATDFSLVPFEECFPFETTRMIDTKDSDYNENHRFEAECKKYSWYALDSFWGTSEERNLVKFIYNYYSNLSQKYDKIRLLRNEEVYKIFDFETGEGFQPDFLLLLKNKNGDGAYIQVFIEPKGKVYAGEDKDAWKEKFLLEISKRYGFKKPFVEETGKYVLFGLPFFNESDDEMYNIFSQSFATSLKVNVNDSIYKEESETELYAAQSVE
ncbi:MAG: DEAD/DEAH box helicase family protein [Treponema sp.]|uniref:DEAD/DEAH box helicase family protein n=1 Tax=Treponema sp. TaxID=166 RepID=UPI00298E2E05|nr:DEAD/DEAH box helicase family protein [Treponema sp.]MCR5386421.1 DEAD/DEAH box helicase family protein [Treponema sp.]